MSKYTTGEIAKLCSVSVRTVQYYDSRGILVPCELSEGGRRLYSEADLDKMRIICYLRDMGFSLDNIGTLFEDGNSEEVISLLLEQQTEVLEKERQECEEKINRLRDLKRILKKVEPISAYTFGDIAHIMKNQKKRRRVLIWIFTVGIIMDVIEVGTLIWGIQMGNWIPMLIGLPIVVALGIYASVYYFRHVAYICPHCHTLFKTTFAKSFWTAHTPNTRRLTCPVCGKKSFCAETYGKEIKKNG